MQAAERSQSPNGDRNDSRHARHDASIQEQLAVGNLADVDQLVQARIAVAAPTEPEVTNVTPASTSSVLISDDERILTRVLVQPPARLLVEGDVEDLSHREAPAPWR